MEVEIRPAREMEMDEYRRVSLTALMISPDKMPADTIKAIAPERTLCAFADGKLATAYAWWPLKMFINGGMVPVAGITFVGTLPVFRGNGFLRQVIQKHFQSLHGADGQPLAVLYASQAAIYQRYGYAVVSTRNAYEVPPRHLIFSRTRHPGAAAGTLRELGDHEHELLSRLYLTFCQHRTGYLKRGKAWWATVTLKPPARNEVLCKVVYEEESQPLGYVIYTIAGRMVRMGQPWQEVTIRDMTWLTPDAYHALWEHFTGMNLAMHVKTVFSPVDDPLPHLLLEPRQLNLSSGDGLLARVVDVEKLIPLRPFPEGGELLFEIRDDLCPWNGGCWRLNASAGMATIERDGRAAETVIPIDTLAMLLFGQISPSEAVRMGRMTINDTGALPQWDRVLRTHHKPFCPDFF